MNENIIEVVTLKRKNGISETKFLELSRAFSEALKREIDGFIKYTITKHSKQEKWMELVWWESMEAAQAAFEKAPQLTEFQQYCAVLDDDQELVYFQVKG